MEDNYKVDIGVLKTQVLTLSTLCNKMDTVIEKLVEQHDRHISKVYDDMENRRLETEVDVREIHDRIDTVLDKMQSSELRIMDKIDDLQKSLNNHNTEEKKQLDQLLQWRWTVAGGILVLAWLLSHGSLDTIVRTFH